MGILAPQAVHFPSQSAPAGFLGRAKRSVALEFLGLQPGAVGRSRVRAAEAVQLPGSLGSAHVLRCWCLRAPKNRHGELGMGQN